MVNKPKKLNFSVAEISEIVDLSASSVSRPLSYTPLDND